MTHSNHRQFPKLLAAALSLAALAACEREPAAVAPAVEPEIEVTTPPGAPSVDAGVFTGTGTISAIDLEAGRVTIAHDAVTSAAMAAATTEFAVENPEALALVQPGQRIEFNFTRPEPDRYVIVGISPTPPGV